MKDLINELRIMKENGNLIAEEPHFKGDFSPIQTREIVRIEKVLGFTLPIILTRIYTEIANGGFGPAYGLMGLKGGMLDDMGKDVLTLYLSFIKERSSDPHWYWPEKLLPLGYFGCGMYYCVDCSEDKLPVKWFEPNPHEDGQPWSESFILIIDSFEEWMFAYIDGEDTFGKYLSQTP